MPKKAKQDPHRLHNTGMFHVTSKESKVFLFDEFDELSERQKAMQEHIDWLAEKLGCDYIGIYGLNNGIKHFSFYSDYRKTN